MFFQSVLKMSHDFLIASKMPILFFINNISEFLSKICRAPKYTNRAGIVIKKTKKVSISIGIDISIEANTVIENKSLRRNIFHAYFFPS